MSLANKNIKKSEKIIVTGGAGFIGSHLVDKLTSEYKCNVIIIDNFSSGKLENIKNHLNNPFVNIINLDLKSLDVNSEFFKDVDVVFHFAANPEVRVSTINPKIHFEENILATFNVLEVIRKYDIKEIVFASSSSVYGEPEKIPVKEEEKVKPVSVYGASKAACENLIHAYSNLYGIKSVILRYANIVGPRLRHGVIYDFIAKLMKNPSKLEILGDGTQTRSYLYISDAIEATLIAWKNLKRNFEIYNVGNKDWIEVNQIAQIITSLMGLKNVDYIYQPILHGIGWVGDVKKIVLSIEKLKNLGWEPKMSSREAVKETAKSILIDINDK